MSGRVITVVIFAAWLTAYGAMPWFAIFAAGPALRRKGGRRDRA